MTLYKVHEPDSKNGSWFVRRRKAHERARQLAERGHLTTVVKFVIPRITSEVAVQMLQHEGFEESKEMVERWAPTGDAHKIAPNTLRYDAICKMENAESTYPYDPSHG